MMQESLLNSLALNFINDLGEIKKASFVMIKFTDDVKFICAENNQEERKKYKEADKL